MFTGTVSSQIQRYDKRKVLHIYYLINPHYIFMRFLLSSPFRDRNWGLNKLRICWRFFNGSCVTNMEFELRSAAAAKSLQSCPTLYDPIDGSPPESLGFSRQEHWSGLPFSSPQESEKWKWSHWVVSDPQQPRGLQPTRLPRPWILQARALEWVPSPSPGNSRAWH